MGEEAATSLEVSHLAWESSTSCNNSFQVAKQTLNERMCPPLVEVSWSSSLDDRICSSMLMNAIENILNKHDTSETSPKQTSFDLGIGFSPISHLLDPLSQFGEKIKINNLKLLI